MPSLTGISGEGPTTSFERPGRIVNLPQRSHYGTLSDSSTEITSVFMTLRKSFHEKNASIKDFPSTDNP